MPRPKPKEAPKLVVFKVPEGIWRDLETASKKLVNVETALPYNSAHAMAKKIVLDWVRDRQKPAGKAKAR